MKEKVVSSLVDVINELPGTGWVRAGSIVSDKSQKEVKRLQKEIETYQSEVKRLKAKVKNKDAELKNKKKDHKQEIERLNKQIKCLEAELKNYRALSALLQPKTETFDVQGVSFKMIHVEGGKFVMGASDDDLDASSNNIPAHEVTLSDYWIGETQVTQALWEAVMGKNSSAFPVLPYHPVVRVSWEGCQLFIRELNKLTGEEFRLPTEAQWEFAARGGHLGKNHQFLYAGSNNIYDVAWYRENSKKTTHSVGELNPNELSLYDMSGNVWEWCNDWFDKNYYSKSPKVDPTGPETGFYRVIRGGSWGNIAVDCRVSCRGIFDQKDKSNAIGLRLVL